MTQLTPHFTLEELTYSAIAVMKGIDNSPSDEIKANLIKLANVLEKVRALLGFPIVVSSGYRCAELNGLVGGVSDSAHTHGLAADIECPEFGLPYNVCLFLKDHLKELEIDQLILEFNSWTHIGISIEAPRYMVLEIDRTGTKEGIA